MARPGNAIQVRGLKELRRDLRRMGSQSLPEIRTILRGTAEIVAREAATRAPRRSGDLAASIRPGTSGPSAFVRSPLPYAHLQEWGFHPRGGSVRVPGRHYVVGALDEKRDEVVSALERGLDQLARRNGWR